MPVQSFDHIQFVGGMLNGSLVKTHALYRGVMEDIYSTYTAEPTGTAFSVHGCAGKPLELSVYQGAL